MTRMVLYQVSIPDDSQTRGGGRTTVRRRLAKHGTTTAGPPTSDTISSNPNEFSISGEFRGDLADVMAEELEELFSSDLVSVPYYGADASRNRVRTQYDGYYSLQNVDPQPVDPRAVGNHHSYSGVIVKEGTSRTHWRSVVTTATQVENDFGNDTTALVAVPGAATKTKWIDRDNKTSDEAATVDSSDTAEHGTVDLYDARAPSFDRPALVFELPYVNEAEVDAKAWDARGQASREDGNGVVRWQRVFSPAHEFEGDVVLSNGILRLTFDESAGTLSAENYASGSWSSTALGTGGNAGNFSVFDVDIWFIGMARVNAQVVWEDSSDGSLFHTEVELPRGYDDALWYIPANETPPFPSGLQSKLTPVADTQDYSARPKQTLQRREDVRK